MLQVGYKLSSEEHGPNDLIRFARLADDAGFSFALISDHYHPWTDRQGQSPFVWAVIGAIARETRRIVLGTGVTCPTIRIHPAIIAQAAATAAAMMPGRFFLGVGTGENLNEHILATWWPPTGIRRDMLAEAVDLIRTLWQGGYQHYAGVYYTVTNARLYTLPAEPPPILVAAGGREAAELAGRVGDGLITGHADRELRGAFAAAGGQSKPCYTQVGVCWAADEAQARRTAHEVWPIAAMPGSLKWELPLPAHFQEAARLVTEEANAAKVVCGPDPERHVAALRQAAEAGFGHVCVHQIGPDQEGFLRFYAREVLPRVRELRVAA
jgi:coenzyme F420-dependent glucose-6-phosphate dehydrogenase